MITKARYTREGSIEAVINGRATVVPDDMGNADRREIAAWVRQGNSIELYVPQIEIPVLVSSRQFKLQLYKMGLLALVETWINAQTPDIKIVYENSATFVRTDEMMQKGFKALGFSEAQIDQFFLAASLL